MTPSEDGRQNHLNSEDSLVVPKPRDASRTQHQPPTVNSPPYRPSNTSLSTHLSLTSSLSPPDFNASVGNPSERSTTPVFAQDVSTRIASPVNGASVRVEEPRSLVARAFVPRVAVLVSSDTEDIVKEKGLPGGFLQLVRPFGDSIIGKVTIRDSNGASRSWDDFGIRFTGFRDGLEPPRLPSRQSAEIRADKRDELDSVLAGLNHAALRTGGDLSQVEEVVDRHASFSDLQSWYASNEGSPSPKEQPSPISPFYSLYLRRLLSGLPMSPHETFSHPVACVIAISSRSKSPIEELRQSYASTNTGDNRLPQWVNNEYLRYYVLVHDEDTDDVTKSISLYEQMKRHFGLHCHLLRLRSSQCVASDDDSCRLPICEWLSAAEELLEIRRRDISDELEDSTPCIFESDATAVRSFVREMVTQSIVPFMERLCATWNEQVVSRRRGLSGRFMSLSKRFAPFSTSSRSSSGSSGPNSSGSNYDSLQGFYRPDTPEATMRKLADFAFMLRDVKLAQSIYDLLRSDFNNDKAWKYYAGANEMAAISTLLVSRTLPSKVRAESVDQNLEAAFYSYLTRSASPYYALRTLAIGFELLKLRGLSASDDAARWASRIIESKLVGSIGTALFTERVGACYKARTGVGATKLGNRQRKSAIWAVLASDCWLKLDRIQPAEHCLGEAIKLYNEEESAELPLAFDRMLEYIHGLQEAVLAAKGAAHDYEADPDRAGDEPAQIEEVSEKFDHRSHRKSLIGATAPFNALDSGPLSPRRAPYEGSGFEDDNFE